MTDSDLSRPRSYTSVDAHSARLPSKENCVPCDTYRSKEAATTVLSSRRRSLSTGTTLENSLCRELPNEELARFPQKTGVSKQEQPTTTLLFPSQQSGAYKSHQKKNSKGSQVPVGFDYNHFHVLGDVGILAVDALVAVLKPWLWSAADFAVEEALNDISEAFNVDNGLFKNCRFLLIVIPHLYLDPLTDMCFDDFEALNTARFPTLLETGAQITKSVLHHARVWRGSSSLSSRQFWYVRVNKA